MREKKQGLVFSFRSTQDAMAVEEYFQKLGIPGRIIPLPKEISAGCGLAWVSPPEDRAQVDQALKELCIQAEGEAVLSLFW